MKNNPRDRMKDPFYAQLMFLVEERIWSADKSAREAGIHLTDSQIRSTLIKAGKLAQGESPMIPETSEREQLLAKLTREIGRPQERVMEERVNPDGTSEMLPLEVSEWIKAIETTLGSIQTRRSQTGGLRDYLDYLEGFIGQMKK